MVTQVLDADTGASQRRQRRGQPYGGGGGQRQCADGVLAGRVQLISGHGQHSHPPQLIEDLKQRRRGHVRCHVRGHRETGSRDRIVDRTAWRVGVALVLTDVGHQA